MSALVEIQERIRSTEARIQEYEKAARMPGAPESLFIGIRSLEKLRSELERDFQKLAKEEEVEVCKYRLLPQQGQRPSLTAIANAWIRYQALFSSVYDSLKKRQQKDAHKRTSKQARTETDFAFAYTYSGSIGVVLTLPTLNYSKARDLSEVNRIISELTRSLSTENIARFVDVLGVPPVARFGDWVDAHVAFAAGAGIVWETTPDPQNLIVQVQEFRALKEAMDKITEPTVVTRPVTGILRMADMDKLTFRMTLDSNERITGSFGDAITEQQKAELPQRYEAIITTTTKIQPALEKKGVSHFLVRLVQRLPLVS